MSIFANSDEKQNNEESNSGGSNKGAIVLILSLLAIPFLLSAIIAYFSYYLLLRVGRFRLSIDAIILGLMSLISIIVINSTSAIEKFLYVITNFNMFSEIWTDTLYLLIPGSVILGSIIGFFAIFGQIRKMKKDKALTQLEGLWQYKFEFRKTPWEKAKKKKFVEKLKSGDLQDNTRAPLGFDEENDIPAYRYIDEAVRMTLVVGAAGSGKTISMLSMMLSDINAGRTVVAVDFKRSPEFAAKLAKWSEERNINFYHFEAGSPKHYRIDGSKGQSTYDPFASGSGAEMILGMREYDTASSVYKTNMQQVLQIIFAMMKQADKRKAPNIDWVHGGIYQLASAIDPKNIKDLLYACEGRPIYREAEQLIHAATASQKNNISHSLEELRGQMRTIVASDYGPWFKLDELNADRQINLVKLLTQDKQSVILFSFNSEDEPELSQSVGSMIFADLRACSGHIRNMKANKVTNVYVDEFQAVPPTAVTGLLEKARESKIAMTLAQQSFEQIITSSKSNGEAYLDSILVTCSNFLIHAGMTLPSAERISNILGKEWVTVYSKTQKSSSFSIPFLRNNNDHVISERQDERWVRDPSDFMKLAAPANANNYKSEAILVNKSVSDPHFNVSGALSRKVWMIPQNEVLGEYVTPQVGGFNNDDDYNEPEELYNDSQYIDQSALLTQDELELMNNDEADYLQNYKDVDSNMDFETINDSFEDSVDSDLDFINLQNIHEYENDFENDDGDFGFEEVEPTSILESDLDSFTEDLKPAKLEKPSRPTRKPIVHSDNDLKKPQPRRVPQNSSNVKKESNESQVKPNRDNPPRRGGLPTF